MSDEEIPEMNLAALRFSARMMDAIKGMRSSIIMFMKERGQEWEDYPAWDLVDGLIAEYGDDPNAEET
jgi:hypothetical protein